MRANQALKLNNKAVIDEQLRLNDPHYERKKNQDKLWSDKQKEAEGSKAHMFVTANAHQKFAKKRDQKPTETFGWDVFNTDSLYRAYEKRVAKMPKLGEGTE